MSGNDDLELERRNHHPPHSGRNPIPTVQGYREEKEHQRDNINAANGYQEPGKAQHWKDAARSYWDSKQSEDAHAQNQTGLDAYGNHASAQGDVRQEGISPEDQSVRKDRPGMGQKQDTTQLEHASDPKEHRKQLKHRGGKYAERDVTDPITHLPVTIRDLTDKELKESEDMYSRQDTEHLDFAESMQASNEIHQGMQKVFPPPSYAAAQAEFANVHKRATMVGMVALLIIAWITLSIVFSIWHASDPNRWRITRLLSVAVPGLLGAGLAAGVVWLTQQWAEGKTKSVWDEQVWEADRHRGRAMAKEQDPESTQWLNMLLGSVWPLINPDLFVSLTDMLEDVMQASLPRMVRMVSIEDLGQGSEPIRIIGIKRLPKGAAAQSVSEDGQLKKGNNKCQDLDKTKTIDNTHDAEEDADADANNRPAATNDNKDDGDGQDSAVAEGMEAEEGDFYNVEIAFAYHSTHSRRARERAKNIHLYMAFYLPGGVKVPVWVELRGLVGTMRARLQLIPDPPFINLCTMTFLGQPKVNLSCVPLVKTGLNIMDLPLISNFVQSAVDAGLSQYVAPRSLTLDIKDLISGDDFKKDVIARGILRIKIKRAYDFKKGDTKIPLVSEGLSDAYVSVGFAKFGKPLWSTRVIVDEMHPYWEEVVHVPIGPEELDADESLRVSLWDSDKFTADDDLGRIELGLKDLMRHDKSNGREWDRKDAFESMKAGEGMPGHLEWSVGYYSKTRLMNSEIVQHHEDPNVKTVEDFEKKIEKQAESKLREASKDKTAEAEQQKAQDYKAASIEMISNSTPSEDYPSGILSIQVHQITGLEFEKQNKSRDVDKSEVDDIDEQDESLPDSYCTIILNHKKIYKTRTKPRNAKPFFNAATERFIRDWRTTSIFVAVRDARVHEDDALMGIVHIPLAKLLRSRKTSRINENFPLAGGIGFGRVRISLVFRAVQLQEKPSHLGWDYGTLEIGPTIESEGLPHDLASHVLKMRTALTKAKISHGHGSADGVWKNHNDKPVYLAVTKRYASNLVIELRTTGHLFGEKTPAFAVLWLCTIADEEDLTLDLPVWKGDLKRAESCTLPDEECGERVGTLKLKLRFHRGMGRYHQKYASKDQDAASVMEILQCANDNNEIEDVVGTKDWQTGGGEGRGRDGDDSDSDGSDGTQDMSGSRYRDEDGIRTLAMQKDDKSRLSKDSDSSSRSGLHGMIDDAKDYLRHKDQLHRRQRGIMQWKAPRTVQWIKHKGEHAKERLSGVFEHHGREPDIETEV